MGTPGGNNTKTGLNSSRSNVENSSSCRQEKEKLPKGQNPSSSSKGIKEADINKIYNYRNVSPNSTNLKQPFMAIGQNENRGNMIRSRGSQGNLHEKNRQAQTQALIRDELNKAAQKEQTSTYNSWLIISNSS